jgi:hypothetical protein
MEKSELSEKIRRRLGYPLVKVELDPSQISDNIDHARRLFIKWAIGQATVDRYYTMILYGGVGTYNLASNVLDVLDYDISGMGTVHQLFTINNYFYNQGMYDAVLFSGMSNSGYSLISYHIARDFLETVQRYVVSPYDYIYHRYSNQLEILPTPVTGGSLSMYVASSGTYVTVDSPGIILLRCSIAEGTDENLYDTLWVHDYALALCKISLGRIRSKFANFSAIGSNIALALDGDTLLQEGQSDIERLEETLRNEEVFDGYDISIG